jgi:hypothetical protein
VHPLHFGGNPLGLVGLLVEGVRLHGAASGRRYDGSRLAGKPSPGGDPHCRRQDLGGHPERSGENQAPSRAALGVGESGGELGDVGEGSATEGVDRLVGVAGDGEVAVGEVEALQQPCLGDGGVLVLVHQQVAELLGHRGPHLGVLQQFDGGPLQGAVVDPLCRGQGRSVPVQEPGEGSPVVALPSPGCQVGGAHQVLLAAKHEVGYLAGQGVGGQQAAEGEGPIGRVLGGEQAGYQGHLQWASSRREAKEWKVKAGTTVRERFRPAATRVRRSATPRREKESSSRSWGRKPWASIRWRARRTRNSVSPAPGPATISWGPSTAATAAGQSSGSTRISGDAVTASPYRGGVTPGGGAARPGR